MVKAMRIKELREAAGLPIEMVAADMGVCPAAWKSWEFGTILPSTRALPRLAYILDCTVEELYEPAYLEACGFSAPGVGDTA